MRRCLAVTGPLNHALQILLLQLFSSSNAVICSNVGEIPLVLGGTRGMYNELLCIFRRGLLEQNSCLIFIFRPVRLINSFPFQGP